MAVALGACLPAQDPAPPAGTSSVGELLLQGRQLLEREDPVMAWPVFRRVAGDGEAGRQARLGLGKVHLVLGAASIASLYATSLLDDDPTQQDAMALQVRALIRGRHFDAAVAAACDFVHGTVRPGAELLAAKASALFRVQRVDEAADAYTAVLALDPLYAEAHLRLGSGLAPPTTVLVGPDLLAAVRAARAGELERAIAGLRHVLAAEPQNPVAHRLLGEVLFLQKAHAAMAEQELCYRTLLALLPVPDLRSFPIAEFLPDIGELSPARRLAAERALQLFRSRLSRLVSLGARHDLLREVERTTDAEERRSLRGRRTFDGRVWDDVRGIGGLRAATGIEALDEAAGLGFDTLAHEVAHQVHYYALPATDRARIRELYQARRQQGRFLDFYAASNEAEYFAQGVEAFAALAKRPGCETTHGHTRFELFAVDRELHDFIAGLVDVDPLRDEAMRPVLLAAAVEVAIRGGRPADAVVAADMLPDGPARADLRARAHAALLQATHY